MFTLEEYRDENLSDTLIQQFWDICVMTTIPYENHGSNMRCSVTGKPIQYHFHSVVKPNQYSANIALNSTSAKPYLEPCHTAMMKLFWRNDISLEKHSVFVKTISSKNLS